MKLKKKTRKQLRRLARAAGLLAAAFATDLLAELTASVIHRRRSLDGHGDHDAARHTLAHEPLPRTADAH